MPVRLAVAGVFAVLALTAGAQTAAAARPLGPPKGLNAFLLRVNEPQSLYNRTFPRTPAFAWRPVSGAKRYEFELSTSQNFSEGAVVWSSATAKVDLPTPAISPAVALPWITGTPYSLYARVRGIAANGQDGRWSAPYGFNMRWRDKPTPLNPQFPGLVRWTPVEGATMYEVWLYSPVASARETFSTTTNVADEREFYTFHTSAFWTGTIYWRIRAVRKLYGVIPNGLPAVTVGPWSEEFVNFNPTFATGELDPLGTVSDIVSTPGNPKAHQLTPAFVFSGNYRSWGMPRFFDPSTELFRVYVFTDSECVNRVYTGSVVGGPAYAPRHKHTIELPANDAALATARGEIGKYGTQNALTLDGYVLTSVDEGALGMAGDVPKIDLWDTFWPAGGYYWTVLPIYQSYKRGSTTDLEFRDIQLAEDVCRAGGAVRFGKVGKPVATGDKAPYVSGLTTSGKLVGAKSATQAFYGFPLVAWEPVFGAQEYEVQWSRTLNPWRTASAVPAITPATSAVLPLTPGRWYYRVRGLNYSLPVKPEMTWSRPVRLRVAKPRFRVVR